MPEKIISKKHWWKILLVTVFIITTVFVMTKLLGTNSEKSTNQSVTAKKQSTEQSKEKESEDYRSNRAVTDKLASCNGKELLSYSPIDLNQVPLFAPLGNINAKGGHVWPSDHLGILLRRVEKPGSMNTIKTNILAPAAVHIFGLRQTTYRKNGVVVTEDFALSYAPCKEVMFYFGHIGSLEGGLKQAVGALKNNCGPVQKEGDQEFLSCEYHLDYLTKPGEVIATAGGVTGATAVGIDWGGSDLRTPALGFLNQDYYSGYSKDQYFHTICPLDYYPQSLKSQLYEKLERKTAPRCGEVMQDKAGTIAGDWIIKPQGNNQNDQGGWSLLLAFLHDNVDPSIRVLAVGGTITTAGTVEYNPKHNGTFNREPGEVAADGKIYCYQNEQVSRNSNDTISGHIIVQLVNDLTMKTEWQAGSCSTELKFNSPTTYRR